MTAQKTCGVCGNLSVTRPYGPGGLEICFGCATASPAVEAACVERFLTLARSAETESRGAGVSLTPDGPRPLGAPGAIVDVVSLSTGGEA